MKNETTIERRTWIDFLPAAYYPFAGVTVTKGVGLRPSEVHRNVQLASVLEPLVVAPGKTTRHGDCEVDQRLAYFLSAGVNIGETFRELAERLNAAREQDLGQPIMYDLALKAQLESKRQRAGGRTNYGIISMLLALIAGQALYLKGPPDPYNVYDSFDCIEKILSRAGKDDVAYLRQMEQLAFKMSRYHDRLDEEDRNTGKTVYEYYYQKYETTRRTYYNELVNGLPVAREIVTKILAYDKALDSNMEFNEIFSHACDAVVSGMPANYTAGLLADNTAVALYVIFSHFQHKQIIF